MVAPRWGAMPATAAPSEFAAPSELADRSFRIAGYIVIDGECWGRQAVVDAGEHGWALVDGSDGPTLAPRSWRECPDQLVARLVHLTQRRAAQVLDSLARTFDRLGITYDPATVTWIVAPADQPMRWDPDADR